MESQTLEDDRPDAEPAPIDARAAEVYRWRFEELERAGYSSDVAHSIAGDHRIDLHDACDLVRHGCPEGTAYRILA